MPCSSAGQDEFYNERHYGLHESSQTIATRVACELGKLVEKHGLINEMSDLALKWTINHRKWDEQNGTV